MLDQEAGPENAAKLHGEDGIVEIKTKQKVVIEPVGFGEKLTPIIKGDEVCLPYRRRTITRKEAEKLFKKSKVSNH